MNTSWIDEKNKEFLLNESRLDKINIAQAYLNRSGIDEK